MLDNSSWEREFFDAAKNWRRYQFENILESASLGGAWDGLNNRWIVDESVALQIIVHVHALYTCQNELLTRNISFSLH